jgi:hypothetical protein
VPSVAGSFLWPLVTRNLLAAAGWQTDIRIVPFCPSAQPQDGLSLPPRWGRFFWREHLGATIAYMTVSEDYPSFIKTLDA